MSKTVSQFLKTCPKFYHLFFNLFLVYNDISYELRQLLKVLDVHPKACHLGDSHSQSTGGRKTFIFRAGLIITDDVVDLQPGSDLRALGIAHLNQHLVGFGEAFGRITRHFQTKFIQGNKVSGLPPYRRDTGMVFQTYALFPHMTVFDNIAFGLRYRKVLREEIKERVLEMLHLVQLPDVQGRKPSQLNGISYPRAEFTANGSPTIHCKKEIPRLKQRGIKSERRNKNRAEE